jgi:hypothetical protein
MSIRHLLVAVSLVSAAVAVGQPTYYGDVSRIFREKCEGCHRPNDLAPFALSDYETAQTWAADIKNAVSDGRMPPWKPKAGHGEFKGAFGLTAEERKAILDWVDAGAPAGDETNTLPPLSNTTEWALGYPDQVLSMLEAYEPPMGSDVYRCFVIPTGFTTDRYVKAVDYLPGDRGIVHHVLLYADTQGVGDRLDAADPGPGYDCFGGPGIDISLNSLRSLLGGWAPGQRAHIMPEQLGLFLPKNAKLIMQVHYYPAFRTAPDQTRVGLYFHEKAPQNTLLMVPVLNQSFRIPVGAEAHKVQETFPSGTLAFLFDAVGRVESTKIYSVYPHMHKLGTEIKVDITDSTPSAREIAPMIYIDKWDFNWQGAYDFVKPLELKSGQRIKLQCTFNNSESNPFNPNNPIIPVTWGERTSDEMCLAFVGVYSNALDMVLGAIN